MTFLHVVVRLPSSAKDLVKYYENLHLNFVTTREAVVSAG